MGDKAAGRIGAVDTEDVGPDAVRDGQVRGAGDDADAVRTRSTATKGTRRAGVKNEEAMIRRARGVEGGDGNMSLVATVLRQVPNRLAGHVLGRGERLNDGGGGTSGVIQHTAAVIEDAVIRGLNGTDAAETIAEGVRAIEREHAALREVGGDEAELTSRLIEDDRVAEDGQGAEEIGRTVAAERPVTRADLDHA